MIGLGAQGRVRPGDLLDLVGRDLRPCTLSRLTPTTAIVTTPDGLAVRWDVEVERRKLMTLQESRVRVTGPAVVGSGASRLVLHHTGQVRRRGLVAKVKGAPDPELDDLRERLLAGDELETASLPLDFTWFVVHAVAGRWTAELTLMGGSHVWTRIPPGGSYVRLAEDQVRALLATLSVLDARLPGEPPRADAITESAAAQAPPVARKDGSNHLPRRSRHRRV